VSSYDPWKSVTVGSLIPSLNPNNASSVISKAKKTIDSSFGKINNEFEKINSYADKLESLKYDVQAAKNAVDNIISAIGNSGFYATVVRNAVGVVDFESGVAAALNGADAPEINDSTCVGAVLLVATGTTTDEVNTAISSIKATLSGL
jgi:hypothetical protein